MRTDAIDLDIFGSRLRVVCEDPKGAAMLRSALADHVIDEPAPLAFSLQVPEGTNTLHVLLDRSGFILARALTTEDGLAVLGSHLAGFVPPPEGTLRIRARALIDSDSNAALAAFPLFVDPPVVERQLERVNNLIVDRLAVDVSPEGMLEMSPTPWPEFAGLREVRGHTSVPIEPAPISTVLVPRLTSDEPSHAHVVAFLATATSSTSDHTGRLDLAERLAATRVRAVPVLDRSALYAALSPMT